jgi:hypothetical protein
MRYKIDGAKAHKYVFINPGLKPGVIRDSSNTICLRFLIALSFSSGKKVKI